MKRRLIGLIVLVGAIAGAVEGFRLFNRQQGMVLTGIVTTHEVNVSPLIQGRLSQLLVKEGDVVELGQLLARIDPQELESDQLYYTHTEAGVASQVQEDNAALKYQEAQTRDQIKQAEAAVAAAEAQQKEAVANRELARLTYERTQGLYQQQVYAAQTLDQARSSYEAAQSQVDALKKQVDAQRAALALAQSTENQIVVRLRDLQALRHQLEAAGAQKTKAQVRLGYTELRAPVHGVVSVLDARQGEILNISQPVLTLINPDDLWVRVDVEETYIDRIHLGETFKVRLPSGDERVGTVYFRGVDADYATQRDVSRTKRDIKTFEVRLRVDNRDRSLWPGLTAFVILPSAVVR